MSKIGILGGSFDPIHNLHIELARAALNDYGLDEVRFMPAANPPHKRIAGGCTVEDRIEMVRLAIKDEERFVLDLYEIECGDKTYTYSTLAEFAWNHPKDRLFFIMGEDSADSFPYWVNPHVICKYATILVGPRALREAEGENAPQLQKDFSEKLNALSERFSGSFLPLSSPKTDISSTKIREFLKNGTSWPDFVPASVAYYIQEKRIYNYVQ